MGNIRISQCMIVKNEEKNIEKALACGKELAFEQIVVDTGSTDRTVELAEKMGAKVLHFLWCDDFSAAKNYALEQATGEWILFLDADEYFSEEDIKKIPGILERVKAAFTPETMPHLIRSSWLSIDDQGNMFNQGFQDRIFRNIPHLRYSGRIHESLTLSEGRMLPVFYDVRAELAILHTGYTESTYERTDKRERNLKMLKKELEEHPDNMEALTYLGETYEALERIEEADKIFYQVTRTDLKTLRPYFRCVAFYYLMRNIVYRNQVEEEKQLLELYKQAVKWDKGFPNYNFMMGLWYSRREDWDKAAEYIGSALEEADSYKGDAPVDITGNLDKAYIILLKAAVEKKDGPAIVKNGIFYLHLDRYKEDVLTILLSYLMREPEEFETAQQTYKLITQIYNMSLVRDKVFVAKCAKNINFYALAKKVIE